MKKSLWVAIAGALAVSVVAASAQEVLSANTIGYIKKELPAGGKLITVSVPLFNMTAPNNVFSNLSLAAEAPVDSEVAFWDVGTQKWVGGAKKAKGGWVANVVTQVVKVGEAFFIKGPATSTVPTEITIAGEVPDTGTQIRAIPGGNQLGIVANPYPADFVFGTSSLASNATVDSEVAFWDVENQKWVGGAKKAKGGWAANVVTQKVTATSGFFMKEYGTVTTWTNAKPYTWP